MRNVTWRERKLNNCRRIDRGARVQPVVIFSLVCINWGVGSGISLYLFTYVYVILLLFAALSGVLLFFFAVFQFFLKSTKNGRSSIKIFSKGILGKHVRFDAEKSLELLGLFK